MKPTAIFLAGIMTLCTLSGCGAASESESTAQSAAVVETTQAKLAETTADGIKKAVKGTTKAGAKRNATVSASEVVKPREAVIAGLTLRCGTEGAVVLDLEDKKGPYAAHVETDGYVSAERLRIYTEDAELADVSDVTVKSDGLVNFYLTGKTAGTGSLYIATADDAIVSDPVSIQVRSAQERAKAEEPVYYTPIGEYWHLSEDCAREDYPGVTYDWKGNQRTVDRSSIRLIETVRGRIIGHHAPCPKCAPEDAAAADQDGE